MRLCVPGWRRWAGMVAAIILPLVAGCASWTVADTVPLAPEALAPPGADTISNGGYRYMGIGENDDLPDLLVLVAMSGGGKRSAAFSYGALKGMRQVMVPAPDGPRPLLHELDGIAGVSGGSFTAAYYGLHRDQMFGAYERDFLHDDTNSYIFGVYLLPWNWGWIADPLVGTNDYMERVYDRTMFHGATYADLMKLGKPIIGIGATDINYGTPIIFTQEYFDLICGDLGALPLARAVAASNGFPGLFSPVTLTNEAAKCGGRRPGWERRVTEAQRRDPFSRIGAEAVGVDRYLDPDRTRFVHLSDGGVSDNLALRVAGSMLEHLSLAPSVLANRGYERLRRILVISVDGQGAQDSSVAQRRIVGGLVSILGLVSGAQIDQANFETLNLVRGQIGGVVRTLRAARCTRGRTIDGFACDDVQGALIHLSLARMPDGPGKDALLAIPTGLTLAPADADALVDAGARVVVDSTQLRDFLRNYPGQKAPVERSR